MNKLMVFPLAVMFMISIFIFVSDSITPVADSTNLSDVSGVTIDEGIRNITIPQAESQSLDIWGTSGAMAILVVALAVGMVAGIRFVGSGVSDLTQDYIFVSVAFLGLWACLTIISAELMFENIVIQVIWLALSLIYMIGIAFQVSKNGVGE